MLFNMELLLAVALTCTSGVWGNDCPQPCFCDHKSITCAESHLSSIPTFEKISNRTTSIDLSYNDIEKVGPYSFHSKGLESLEYLYLNENMINYIDAFSFVFLYNLQVLDLSYNFLEGVPSDMIKQNQHIWQLNLSSNYFHDGPPQLMSKSLEILDLSLCTITSMKTENVQGLPNLQVLFLHANYLIRIEIDIFKDTILNRITLAYNYWKCDLATKLLFAYLLEHDVATDQWVPCFAAKRNRRQIELKH